MTDLEISKQLALAIGWSRDCMALQTGVVRCYYPKQMAYDSSWRVFDYRDWAVIGPIAEKYDCFPFLLRDGNWKVFNTKQEMYGYENTPQKAIALAIIQGAEK